MDSLKLNSLQSKHIGLLFSRLRWPSQLVRERSAIGIYRLLIEEKFQAKTYEHLLEWLKSQRLESICFLGLIPLAKAVFEDNFQLDSGEIWAYLGAPSILSWQLIHEMDSDFKIDFNDSLIFSKNVKTNPARKEYFEKYIKYYVPGIYSFWAGKIENNSGFSFMDHWFIQWYALIDEYQISLTDNMRYWMSASGDNYTTADVLLSEAYRSAFLRTLAMATSQNYVSPSSSVYLSSTACPIDFDLWKVKPQHQPTWWPDLTINDAEEFDMTLSSAWKEIEVLWNNKESLFADDTVLAAFQGSIGHTTQTIHYEISVYSAFQKTGGNTIPLSNEIAALFTKSNKTTASIERKNKFCFDGSILTERISNCELTLGDWLIKPITSSTTLFDVVSRWQRWRIGSFLFPSSCISNTNINFTCQADKIIFETDGSTLGYWQDWLEGLHERNHHQLPDRGGQYLAISKELIDTNIKETNSNFCWVCQITVHYKDKKYDDDFKTFQDTRVFGHSNVVKWEE